MTELPVSAVAQPQPIDVGGLTGRSIRFSRPARIRITRSLSSARQITKLRRLRQEARRRRLPLLEASVCPERLRLKQYGPLTRLQTSIPRRLRV